MTTVLLIDDQAVIRAGLRSVLESADVTIVGEASEGSRGVELARSLRPDVVLMDLRMPGEDGISATSEIRSDPALDDVRILVLTTFDGDGDVVAALSAGADGFLGKAADPDEIIQAVERVAAGESSLSARASRAVITHLSTAKGQRRAEIDSELAALVATLTPRERDLVAAAARGEDNAAIARRLFISPLTVKTHINRAMTKLGARDRGQLVAFAYRGGIV
ncbi:response regulator transcription factor [Microbacterium sp. JZ37]|uniref:response regulator transcription factor n=1 Tax=Microbacterium sp. JZ37 TaxID=2654193 RepID=UPI002B4A9E1C|nr:response regulator transcription factor [Microbacterium sp. JZ37]WRH17795.1 response regulator [Microbacterium sp. JZ37]